MRQKKLGIVVVLILLLMFSSVALAAYNVTVWNDDTNSSNIYYMNGGVKAARPTSMTGFALADFDSYATVGLNAWNNANCPAVWNTSYNVICYGGTLAGLQAIYGSTYQVDWRGLTVKGTTTKKGTATVNGVTRSIYQTASAKVFLLYRPSAVGNLPALTANHYKSTMVHEIGHCLAWAGHSNNNKDAMYHTGGTITTLTTRDKAHVQQMYQ